MTLILAITLDTESQKYNETEKVTRVFEHNTYFAASGMSSLYTKVQ